MPSKAIQLANDEVALSKNSHVLTSVKCNNYVILQSIIVVSVNYVHVCYIDVAEYDYF